MPDFAKLAETAERLISQNGRVISVVKHKQELDDNTKAWRGTSTPRVTPASEVEVSGVFVPIGSRTFLGIEDNSPTDIKRGEQVVLVAANSTGEDLRTFNEIVDDDQSRWKIIRAQLLRPGATRLLYAFEVKR